MSEEKQETFGEYIKAARSQFVQAVYKKEWDTDFRTEIDSFLIAYDQMRDRIEKLEDTP